MKKIFTISTAAVFILAAAMFSSCTVKQQENLSRTVTVTGSGQVEIESDQATIILSVITRNYDVTKAVQENADKMTKVQESLIASGLNKQDITTNNYSIYQESSYSGGRSIPGQYNVSNNVQIIVRDISKAGTVIDTAVKAGANSLSSLTFDATKQEEAVKQARILAIKQAEETASLLASTSGSTLGKIITITEQSGNSYPRASLMKTSAVLNDAAPTPISADKTTVSITVNCTYELQ